MVYLRKYGESAIIDFELFEVDGVDFRVDAIHASGDTKIMKDEGAEGNTNSGFVDEGQGYSLAFTSGEMTAARIVVYIKDQTATKVWLDRTIKIETYGHASAQHPEFPADVTKVSGDSDAADKLELQYDGTGLTGDTFPANQRQLEAVAAVGSAVNVTTGGYLLTTGTQSSGEISKTIALDGVNHEHTDDGGALDLYYNFLIGGDGVPTSVTMTGYLNGNNDDLEVYAYNWGGSSWTRIGTLSGKATASNEVHIFNLFTAHVGTGASLGAVRIRFTDGAFTLSSATLAIDQIFVSYAVVARSVGYADGAIWINTNVSNTNTESSVDGTADNPVSTWAAALTLSGNLNMTRFHIVNGSTITLTGNSDHYTLIGNNWILNLNSQSIVGIYINGAFVNGIGTGTGDAQEFESCFIETSTHIKKTHFITCAIDGTVTVSEAGDYFWDRCHSGIAGTGTPIFEFGDAIGSTNFNCRNYSGGIQLESMGDTGTDTASIEGRGQIVEGTCTGGTVAVRGFFSTSGITNLTLVELARFKDEGVQKNKALSNFTFKMIAVLDEKPLSGLTVTGKKRLDNGSFISVAGAITEVSGGYYNFNAVASDTNGDIVAWVFDGGVLAHETEIIFQTVT